MLAPDGSGVEVPEELRPLSWLIGRWIGVGTGQYPTIDDFRFGQEVVISTDGRPFLSYMSRTWLLDDDGERVRPLGVEAGFWRPRPDNVIELTLAHPTGYAEIWTGSLEVTGMENAVITGARATLHTDVVARTESAKDYSAGERLYGLVEGRLLWTFDMQAVGQGMINHLAATLTPDERRNANGDSDG
ncbi:MAG: FABP family protein [Candidatus Nanopelagicales bacterium]|nr:FABP family protein [Candidatus Nanopelagicales bacterium]MCF8556485.1 FABP family protein [Candidatus Nanopelagicales bacterium]